MTDRQEKKTQFESKKKKKPVVLLVLTLAVVAVAGVVGWIATGGDNEKYPLVSNVQGELAIPLRQVDDGKAHFFSYQSGETTVDFFVLKSDDGVVRAALDTCDVCYRDRKGYRQEGDFMVCNNCNQKFRSDMINEIKGGCNPAPVGRNIVDGKVIIAEADLVNGARFFKGPNR